MKTVAIILYMISFSCSHGSGDGGGGMNHTYPMISHGCPGAEFDSAIQTYRAASFYGDLCRCTAIVIDGLDSYYGISDHPDFRIYVKSGPVKPGQPHTGYNQAIAQPGMNAIYIQLIQTLTGEYDLYGYAHEVHNLYRINAYGMSAYHDQDIPWIGAGDGAFESVIKPWRPE